MHKIEVSESAIDSLKAMVLELQGQRDILLTAVHQLAKSAAVSVDNPSDGFNYAMVKARAAIAACTDSKVMEA